MGRISRELLQLEFRGMEGCLLASSMPLAAVIQALLSWELATLADGQVEALLLSLTILYLHSQPQPPHLTPLPYG